MKTALRSVWKENNTRAGYPLATGVLFVIVVVVLGALQEKGTGLLPSFLAHPR